MAKREDHRTRPWIKLRLADSNDAHQADKILDRWREARKGAQNIAREIRVYDALLKGNMNMFHKLMVEYFPGYGMTLPFQPPQSPVVERTNGNENHKAVTPARKPAIIISSEAYNDDDDDELGFNTLDLSPIDEEDTKPVVAETR